MTLQVLYEETPMWGCKYNIVCLTSGPLACAPERASRWQQMSEEHRLVDQLTRPSTTDGER